MFFPIVLSSCALFGETEVEGRFLAEADADADPVEDGLVTLYSTEGERLGWDVSESDGSFAIHDLPPSTQVLTVVEALPEFIPTAFSGALGSGTITVPDGSLFAWSEEEAADNMAKYGNLTAGQQLDREDDLYQGFVYGSVVTEIDASVYSPLSQVWARVFTDTATYDGVYLDESGVPDDDLERTSGAGQFAVFNVPEGIWPLGLSMIASDGLEYGVTVPVYVPGDGVALIQNLVLNL